MVHKSEIYLIHFQNSAWIVKKRKFRKNLTYTHFDCDNAKDFTASAKKPKHRRYAATLRTAAAIKND